MNHYRTAKDPVKVHSQRSKLGQRKQTYVEQTPHSTQRLGGSDQKLFTMVNQPFTTDAVQVFFFKTSQIVLGPLSKTAIALIVVDSYNSIQNKQIRKHAKCGWEVWQHRRGENYKMGFFTRVVWFQWVYLDKVLYMNISEPVRNTFWVYFLFLVTC